MSNEQSNQTVSCEKKIHLGWQEKPILGRNIIGKYQYIYSNRNETISLVELPDYFMDGKTLWEIYQIKGDRTLFEDVERFDTQQEGEKQAKAYLTERRDS